MLISFILVVFCSSILVVFSQELIGLFKKISALPGVNFLFPLLIASLLIEVFMDWGQWLLLKAQHHLHQLVNWFASLLPFDSWVLLVVRVLVLFVLAVFPLWVYHGLLLKKGSHQPFSVLKWTGLVLWIIAVILLCVVI